MFYHLNGMRNKYYCWINFKYKWLVLSKNIMELDLLSEEQLE